MALYKIEAEWSYTYADGTPALYVAAFSVAAVSRNHALNKATVQASRFPGYADRVAAGMKTRLEVSIKE